MSSTATIELTYLDTTANDDSNQPSRSAIPPNDGNPATSHRVFDAAPYSSLNRTLRLPIVSLIVASNIVQFVSTTTTIGGGLEFSKLLGNEVGPGQANWMAASYSLTQGAFVLVTGRLGAIYGHQRLMLLGCGVFTLFSFINAFCTTYESFIAIRALTGIGGGIFMPNCVAVITLMVPPGRARNVTMGIFASAPPVGGVMGALLAGVFTQYIAWKWLFILIAGTSALLMAPLVFLLPKETRVDKDGKIDYIGALLGLGGLLLFNVAWNQAPSVGWSTPYNIACLVLSVVLLAAFLVWEHKFAKEPIMPLKVFRAPSFTALIFVVLLSYMSFGISIWYAIAWQQMLRGLTVLQTGINCIPFGVGSLVAVGICAWMISRFEAQWIMAIGVMVVLVANILLATMPVHQTYWAQTFPAMILVGFCPDLVYVAAQLIACNSVSRRHQGVAGSLVGTLNLYGNSLGLGFAGTIETEIVKSHGEHARGFRAALYFAAGLALVALCLDLAFVRLPKVEREGWDSSVDEDQDAASRVAEATTTGAESRTITS